jgi:rhomboid family GlyGly-CTERM serine protease
VGLESCVDGVTRRLTNCAAFAHKIGAASWVGPAGIALFAITLSFGGEAARSAFRYDRFGIEGGEVWRLVTGHFVHLSTTHLAMNLAALAVLGMLFTSRLGRLDWAGATIVAILVIDAGLFWLDQNVPWYVGLSGVLHGLWAAGGCKSFDRRYATSWLLMLALIGKLAWEYWLGAIPLSAASVGGPVLAQAHLYGALGGATWFAIDKAFRRESKIMGSE